MGFKGKLYFITAKHVLQKKEGQLRNDTIVLHVSSLKFEPVEITVRLAELNAKGKVFISEKYDLTILEVGILKNASNFLFCHEIEDSGKHFEIIIADEKEPKKLDYDDVGGEIFIFGYPSSLGLEGSGLFDYKKPLVRKGIISNIYKEKGTFVMSFPVYFGDSGGPVTLLGKDTDDELVGMVTNYIPFVQKWYDPRNDLHNEEYLNSGYSVALSVEKIFEFLAVVS